MSFLWILLLGLAGLLITLILRNDAGSVFGMDIGSFGQLGVLLALLAFIGIGTFRGQRVSEGFKNAATWALILLTLLVVYTYRNELKPIANRLTGELIPGLALSETNGETITVNRGMNGHFLLRAEIGGETVNMVVDTGASAVVLSAEDAEKIGIDLASLNFQMPVETANGRSFVSQVTLDAIRVGPIELRNVSAAVAQPGNLQTSLLGISFLDRLSSYEFSGSKLVLRP